MGLIQFFAAACALGLGVLFYWLQSEEVTTKVDVDRAEQRARAAEIHRDGASFINGDPVANDAVRAARELRRRRTVRWFHLAGRTPWPETVELLDTVPEGLVGR